MSTKQKRKESKGKLKKGTVDLLWKLMRAGASEDLIDTTANEYKCDLNIALIHAFFHRLHPTREKTPYFSHLLPVFLGWKLEEEKEKYCGPLQGIAKYNNFPWAPRISLLQPPCPSSSCSMISFENEWPENFRKVAEHASQFHKEDVESFEKQPSSEQEEHCFSLQHALFLINAFYCAHEGFTLRASSLVSPAFSLPGQSLVLPVRFHEFTEVEHPTYRIEKKISQGLMITEPLRKLPLDKERSDLIQLHYIPFPQGMNYMIHQGTHLCLNNWKWERR